MRIYNDLVQGTDEWLKLRAGKFTASLDFQQLVTGRPDTYKKLIRKKAAEKITGQLILNDYTNANMERGNALEGDAIEAFQINTGLMVDRVGFVELNEWAGCSPDGLIGNDSGIEIKCKDIHTHLNCLIDGYDSSYKWQIQGNMYITGRKSWWFVSYNPNYVHSGKHIFVEKIPRDNELIAMIKSGIDKGIIDVGNIIKSFGKM